MKITIQDLAPHVARCREVLDPRRAGILGDQQAESLGISLNKEGAIRRKWDDINEADIYTFKAFLDFYTDATNVSDGGADPIYSVTNPIVGDATNSKIIAPGTYRQAFTIVRPMANDKYSLIQELRLGWIEELVTEGAVDYSEARVETIDWYNASGNGFTNQDFITLVWKGVSPYKVNAIVESLKGLAATGWTPVVNGNTLTAHHRLFVRQQEEVDGSSSIRVLLGNSRLKYTAYENWQTERKGTVIYHFGVPSDLVQAVIDSERVIGGSARVSDADQRGLHSITISISEPDKYETSDVVVAQNCSSIEYMDMYLGLTEAEMEAVELGTAALGESLSLRRQSRGDGYWDVIVTRQVTQTRTPVTNQTIEISPSGTTVETQILGYKESTLPAFAEEAGSVKRRDIQVLNDCAKNIIDRKTTPTDQTSQDRTDSQDRLVVVDKHTEKATPEAVSETIADGTLERVQNEPTRAGNYQTAKEVHTARDRVTEMTASRADMDEEVEEHTATATEATVGTPTAFQTVTVENEESEFKNRFRTRKTTRTRKNQTATGYDYDRTDERVTVRQTQADQPAEPKEVAVGRRVIVVTPTETQKFDVQDTTETPRPFDTGWVEFPNRQGMQIRVFINSPDEDFDAWPYEDGNNTLRISPKSNGRYDLTGYSEPDTTTINSELDSCSQTEVTVEVNKAEDAVTIGDKAYNQIIEIRNVELPDGSYQTRKTTRTFLDQEGTVVRASPTEHTVTNVNTNVDPAEVPTVPASGSVDDGEVIISISPTQTCAKRVEQTTVTPIEFDTGWISYTTKWGTAYIRNILNATEATVSGFKFPGEGVAETIPDPENEGEFIDNPDFVDTTNHERGLSIEPQQNGRYRVSASARPNTASASGGLAAVDGEDWDTVIENERGKKFKVEIKYTASIILARDHIDGTMLLGSGYRPGITYIGRGIFQAIKVTLYVAPPTP